MLATSLTEQPPHAQRTAELMQTAWATSAEKRLRAGQVGHPPSPPAQDVQASSRASLAPTAANQHTHVALYGG
jgi:hypothetical protein